MGSGASAIRAQGLEAHAGGAAQQAISQGNGRWRLASRVGLALMNTRRKQGASSWQSAVAALCLKMELSFLPARFKSQP